MEMSILCLSLHCILEVDNLLFSFIGSQMDRTFAPGSSIPRVSPVPDLDYLDDEIWNFLSWWQRRFGTSSWWWNGLRLFFFFINLFIYFWLCWVFVSVRGFSLVAASGGHSSSRCAGFSLLWPLLLRSTGSRRTGSVVVAYGPSCSAACGIFPDQGSNLCPLHWQADSQTLRHQGSPS